MSDDLVERVEAVIARQMMKTVPYEPGDRMYLNVARAAIAVCMEEAAKVCDGIESETWRLWKTHSDMLDQGRSDGAGDCAAAIRALVKEPQR